MGVTLEPRAPVVFQPGHPSPPAGSDVYPSRLAVVLFRLIYDPSGPTVRSENTVIAEAR